MNGGKNADDSGHGRQSGRQPKRPAEQALQANTAGGLSARHRPERNNQQMAGLAANTAADDIGWPFAVQVRGGSAVVLALKKASSDLPNVPTPPNAFACHCPYPLP